MSTVYPLIEKIALAIPDSWLADPGLYADRLICLLERNTHPQSKWVFWNPAAVAVSRPLMDWLGRQITGMPNLNHIRVIALEDARAVAGNQQKSRRLLMREDAVNTSHTPPAGVHTPCVPLIWRRDYLIQELGRAFDPLPSTLYLPYEIMPMNPNQIAIIPDPRMHHRYGLAGYKPLNPPPYPLHSGIRWRVFPSNAQLEGVVPVIANSRAYRQAAASGLGGSTTNPFKPGNGSDGEDEPGVGAGGSTAAPSLQDNGSARSRHDGPEAEQGSGAGGSPPAAPSGTSPAISILLPVYNMRATLGWAVRSVLAQSFPDFELLIGDDGSEDGTADLPYLLSDPRIHIHRFAPNRGKVFVLNELLGLARGRYVLELDGDDWLQPEAAALLTAAMDDAPEAAIATGASGLWQGTRHLGPLWRGALPYRGHRADADAAAPLVPRLYRAAMLRGIGGWPIRAGADARLFEDIAVCEALLAEHPHPAVIHRPVYHRVLRADSVSQRGGSRYPAWFKAQAVNMKGGHPQ